VHDSEQNRRLGNYWGSIITSCLQDDAQGWRAVITEEPWILGDARPSAAEAPDEYQHFFVALARRYQDHRFHNHSCFKDVVPGGTVDATRRSNTADGGPGP
jgi:hypothetical protein